MSILIKNVLLDGKRTHILIEDNIISKIGEIQRADYEIDGMDKVALPGLINTHTHAAMTLLRGYADDYPLQQWLEEKIWPVEKKLTEEDVYWGVKLACLEMIKTGTTTFSDMYWFEKSAADAVREMGLRAFLAEAFFDFDQEDVREESIKRMEEAVKYITSLGLKRVQPALGPHAPYTVSKKGLEWIRDFATHENLLVHFHLAETKKEIDNFIKKTGMRLIEFLDKISFLSRRLIIAHAIWLNDEEVKLLVKRGVKVSHNPVSNMKLASGVFPYKLMKQHDVVVSLGTDGCASNNNLNMFEEMKFASLLQKVHSMDPTALPKDEVFRMATINGAKALGINAGEIKESKLADIILVDLNTPSFAPNHDVISNLAYSIPKVDTVICDGKILMENGKVPDEEEIIKHAERIAKKLVEG